MIRQLAVVSLVLITSGAATAGPFQVHVPRDPRVIQQMQSWLGHDWQTCAADQYPTDTVGSTAKAESAVKVVQAGKRLAARLKVRFATIDGRPLAASPAQKRLVRCLRRRFHARRFHPDRRTRVGTGIVVTNPFTHSGVLQADGSLAPAPARVYLDRHVRQASKRCRAAKPRTPMRITVDVATTGRVTNAAVTGGSPKANGCVSARLKQLRFPRTTRTAQVISRL